MKSKFVEEVSQAPSPSRRLTVREAKRSHRDLQRARHAETLAKVQAIKLQLKEKARKTRFVLMPGEGRLVWWDFVTAIALIYTAIGTPVEVAFLPPTTGCTAAWREGFFLLNRFIDVIFSADIILNFWIAYYTIDSQGEEVLVTDHALIISRYLRSWFFVDAFTVVVPSTFDLYLACGPHGDEEDGSNSLAARATLLRVLRVLRLFKLVRLARASRVVKRWRTRISLSNGTLTLMRCMFDLFIASHWCACVFALQVAMENDQSSTWLGEQGWGFCVSDDSTQSLTEQSLAAVTVGTGTSALRGCDISFTTWYLASFSWSILIITGTGGTGHWPTPRSDIETLLVTIIVVCGAFLYTTILARFCEVATNSNPAQTQFLQRLDDINTFAKVHNLPKELTRRMREYMHEQSGVQLRLWAAKAIPTLSTKLQTEVLLHVHRPWLDAIWFIRDLEVRCKVMLATEMESLVLTPAEVAPRRKLYVIGRGLVMYGMKVLHRGAAWGEDVILYDERYFSPHVARAMTYTEVTAITRATMLSIVRSFPFSYKQMRRAAILLALRRHMIMVAKSRKFGLNISTDALSFAMLSNRFLSNEGRSSGGFDFIDATHMASQELKEIERQDEEHEIGMHVQEKRALHGPKSQEAVGMSATVEKNVAAMSSQLAVLQLTCAQLSSAMGAITDSQAELSGAVATLASKLDMTLGSMALQLTRGAAATEAPLVGGSTGRLPTISEHMSNQPAMTARRPVNASATTQAVSSSGVAALPMTTHRGRSSNAMKGTSTINV